MSIRNIQCQCLVITDWVVGTMRSKWVYIVGLVVVLTGIHVLYRRHSHSGQDRTRLEPGSNAHFEMFTRRQAAYYLESSPEAIQKDLERCSLALGVKPESLARANDTLRAISLKASQFLSRLWSVVPRHLSPEYKNPCWYANATVVKDLKETLFLQHTLITTRRYSKSLLRNVRTDKEALLCLPYLFLADFPKSGTTTLYSMLVKHESIARPQFKEVNWWTKGPLGGEDETAPKRAVLVYLLNFFASSQEILKYTSHITIDATPGLMSDGSTLNVDYQDYCAMPAVVSRVLPSAKFIVIMRNPVDRVYSHYLQKCTSRIGPGLNIASWPQDIRENPAGHFHKELVSDLHLLKECIQHHSLLECVRFARLSPGRQLCGVVGNKLTGSIYHIHLQKWLQFYPREQFLYLRMEEMSSDPHGFVSRITKFLGIEDISEWRAKEWCAAHRNAQEVVGTPETELLMREESRELLTKFYKPYNHALATLLNDSGFLWDTQ